jgi:hypothetical protein
MEVPREEVAKEVEETAVLRVGAMTVEGLMAKVAAVRVKVASTGTEAEATVMAGKAAVEWEPEATVMAAGATATVAVRGEEVKVVVGAGAGAMVEVD